MNRPLPKPALTVLTFVALVMAPQLFPPLQGFKSLDMARIGAVLDFPAPKTADETELLDAANTGAYSANDVGQRSKRLAATVAKTLQDPRHEMDHFYRALARGETVHVLHYGDSPTTADLITADVRTQLQNHFGNAGVGFVLAARPWAWYNRRGVEMTSSGWQPDVGGQSAVKDGLFGLGAVSFRGAPNSVAQWKLRDHAHTSVEIAYLMEAPPAGGEFSVEADGNVLGTIQTEGDAGIPGFARFDLPLDAGTISVRVTQGAVRIFGADFRKTAPGIVYSSLGVNGANVTLLSHAFDAQHWTAELRHYHPDLVIVNYGTNESGFSTFVDTTWGGELRKAIARIRVALPDASILLMSPMDRGEKDTNGGISTLPALPRLVAMEQKIAFEQGVAFFNTFEAMGGEGTMARWYAAEPRLVGADYIHPMPAGARIVGELLFSAFRQGYEQYKMQDAHTPRQTAAQAMKREAKTTQSSQ